MDANYELTIKQLGLSCMSILLFLLVTTQQGFLKVTVAYSAGGDYRQEQNHHYVELRRLYELFRPTLPTYDV